MTLPSEVREAVCTKIEDTVRTIAVVSDGDDMGYYLVDAIADARHETDLLHAAHILRDASADIFDAALSALEAAGWEVNRKGTREALGEAVAYADGISWAEGMPIDKQASRLTFYCTTDDGAEYEVVWDVAKARAFVSDGTPQEADSGDNKP